MRAIIMAGGKGTRLRPYTAVIPKPLVPLGEGETIMENIVRQLARDGFRHITVAVNHLANLIMAYFGDGSKWGIKIDYSIEKEPLNTIGPLTLIKDLPNNFLVVNGDTLTDINYRKFLSEHTAKKNIISVAVKKREVKIDFGVVKFDDRKHIVEFKEKPVHMAHVAIGVNCFNRSIIRRIPQKSSYGFDTLITDSIRSGEKIWACEFDGFWLDIGRPEDYQYAVENLEELKKIL